MKKVFCFGLFLIGFLACCRLALYLFGMVCFVAGDGEYVGAVARTSKWTFLLCPLVFFVKIKEVWNLLGLKW